MKEKCGGKSLSLRRSLKRKWAGIVHHNHKKFQNMCSKLGQPHESMHISYWEIWLNVVEVWNKLSIWKWSSCKTFGTTHIDCWWARGFERIPERKDKIPGHMSHNFVKNVIQTWVRGIHTKPPTNQISMHLPLWKDKSGLPLSEVFLIIILFIRKESTGDSSVFLHVYDQIIIVLIDCITPKFLLIITCPKLEHSKYPTCR